MTLSPGSDYGVTVSSDYSRVTEVSVVAAVLYVKMFT